MKTLERHRTKRATAVLLGAERRSQALVGSKSGAFQSACELGRLAIAAMVAQDADDADIYGVSHAEAARLAKAAFWDAVNRP